MMENTWEPINKYRKRDNVQVVGSRHMFPGVIYTTVLVDFNNPITPIKYYFSVTRVIKYPARVLYWLGRYTLPYVSVLLIRVFTLARPFLKSTEYSKAVTNYKKFYDSSDILRTPTSGNLYSPIMIPEWIDVHNKVQLLKYAKGVLLFSSKTTGQVNYLIKKHFNSDVHYVRMDPILMSILAGITPPGDEVNRLSNLKKPDKDDLE